jgi:hypothetical protein
MSTLFAIPLAVALIALLVAVIRRKSSVTALHLDR